MARRGRGTHSLPQINKPPARQRAAGSGLVAQMDVRGPVGIGIRIGIQKYPEGRRMVGESELCSERGARARFGFWGLPTCQSVVAPAWAGHFLHGNGKKETTIETPRT